MTEHYNAKITYIWHFYPTLALNFTYTLKSSLKKWTFAITFVTIQVEHMCYDEGIFKNAVLGSGLTPSVGFCVFDSPSPI